MRVDIFADVPFPWNTLLFFLNKADAIYKILNLVFLVSY
jgi:hypothetical protein